MRTLFAQIGKISQPALFLAALILGTFSALVWQSQVQIAYAACDDVSYGATRYEARDSKTIVSTQQATIDVRRSCAEVTEVRTFTWSDGQYKLSSIKRTVDDGGQTLINDSAVQCGDYITPPSDAGSSTGSSSVLHMREGTRECSDTGTRSIAVSGLSQAVTNIREQCAAVGRPYDAATRDCGSINGVVDPNAPEEADDTTTLTDTSLCNGIEPIAIRWAACPVTELLQGVVTGIDAALHTALDYDTKAFQNEGYRGAWESFRTIALGLIIIAGLLIVIAQAAGVQILDAYTIKKAVPRLVIAVLFIALSWPLMELIVTFVNDIGRWVERIVEAPFASIQTSSGETAGLVIANLATVGILGIIFSAGGIPGLWPVVFSFLLVGAAGVIMAMLVVGIRTALITLCIIAAPLAIACSILPGTDKVFDLWRRTFISCLVVYPIIMLLLAAGKVSSVMVDSQPVISLLLYFAPYFAIPFAFRLAGGIMGQLAGLANNANRGLFDRQRQARQGQYDMIGNNFKRGKLFGGETNRAAALNRGVGALSNLRHIKSGSASRWGNQIRAGKSVAGEAAADEEMENNPFWRSIAASDTYREAFANHGGVKAIDNYLAAAKPEMSDATRGQISEQIALAQRTASPEMRRIMAGIGDAADGSVQQVYDAKTGTWSRGIAETAAWTAQRDGKNAPADEALAERMAFRMRGMQGRSRADQNVSAGRLLTDVDAALKGTYTDVNRAETIVGAFLNTTNQDWVTQKGQGVDNTPVVVNYVDTLNDQIAQITAVPEASRSADQRDALTKASEMRDKILTKLESIQPTARQFGNAEALATVTKADAPLNVQVEQADGTILSTREKIAQSPEATLYRDMHATPPPIIDPSDPRYSLEEDSDDKK